MEKIGNYLKDTFDFRNKKVDELLKDIKNTVTVLFKKIPALNSEKLNELLPLQTKIEQKLDEITKDFNRKTRPGTALVEYLSRKTERILKSFEKITSTGDQFEIERFYKEILSYNDHLFLTRSEINQLSYQRGALTVMGYILAFLPPPVGVFSLAIGILLFLDKDVRAKINGLIIIVCAAIIFIYNYFLF